MSTRRRALTRPLGEVIAPLVRPAFARKGMAEQRIITEWAQIVGPVLARHSVPCRLSFPPGKQSGGTLTVEVASGWAPELQHLEGLIRERIAAYFGYPAVAGLRLRQTLAPPSAPPAAPPKTEPQLSEADLAQIDAIEDPALREALRRLCVGVKMTSK